jgi:hypothetical protein
MGYHAAVRPSEPEVILARLPDLVNADAGLVRRGQRLTTAFLLAVGDPEMLRFVGIDPTEEKIVVVKSTIHYRAAFEPIAREIVEVDAPGLSSSNLARFAFKRIRRPIFPLDRDTPYPPPPSA